MPLFAAVTALCIACVLVYWRLVPRSGAAWPTASGWLVAAPVAAGWIMCGLSLALEQDSRGHVRIREPLAIAVAFDLSPSMLAIPDPRLEPGYEPRFERGRDTLLAFFDGLEERRDAPLVAMIGFTHDAEILMGWDRSYARVREILDYALAPDLFGSSGTSIGAALERVEEVFGMLPPDARDDARKLVVVVSDGEDTTRRSSLEYALGGLAARGYDVIAVQAGLLRAREGVPQDGIGPFPGFRRYGGRQFTVPDVAAMTGLSDAGASGLYVRAEDRQAAAHMLRFVAPSGRRASAADASLLAGFGMFIVVAALCGVLLR